MKLPKNRESGQVLIMALILLALGSLLVVPGLNLATTNLGYHQLIEDKTLESYSADSGMQYALCELYNNPGEYELEPFTINGRTVNVTVECVATGLYKITSTATSGSGRSTTIECYVNLSVGAFAFAIATKEGMTLQNTIVESYPDAGEGHIHSNANIELTGCEIHGDATAVGTISGGTVYGIPTGGSSPVAFPQDYSALYEQMAKGPNGDNIHEGNYIITGGTESLGPLYINGDLRVEDATVTLTGTVYVTGMISVENGNLDGNENIVAEGNIRIEQGAVRSDIIPIIICIKVDGEIVSETGTTVDGVLYCPYGNVRLEDVYLYGAVGGKTVTIENCTIIYAKQLHGRTDIPGGELHTIAYSYK